MTRSPRSARRSLDDMEGWLPAAHMAFVRFSAEQAEFFARYPAGHDEVSFLRELAWVGAGKRYGQRVPRTAGDPAARSRSAPFAPTSRAAAARKPETQASLLAQNLDRTLGGRYLGSRSFTGLKIEIL